MSRRRKIGIGCGSAAALLLGLLITIALLFGSGKTTNTPPSPSASPAGKAPVLRAVDATATVTSGMSVDIDVLAHDGFVSVDDTSALTLVDVGRPGHGTAKISGRLIVYQADQDYAGRDSFPYTVSAAGQRASAKVLVEVLPSASPSHSGPNPTPSPQPPRTAGSPPVPTQAPAQPPHTAAPTQAPAEPSTAQAPSGATALCNDGTYSFSQHRRGTCSHHQGVKEWLANIPS